MPVIEEIWFTTVVLCIGVWPCVLCIAMQVVPASNRIWDHTVCFIIIVLKQVY